MFTKPKEAYEKALDAYGPIIRVQRKGRMEYIVDDTLTSAVLTADSQFSFVQGTASILNMHYVLTFFPWFYSEVDDLVQNAINNQLENIAERIFPVFIRKAIQLVDHASGTSVDMFHYAHSSIAEAMIIVALGEVKLSLTIAADIATVVGIYQNTSPFARTFPSVWRICTWFRIVVTSIIGVFVRILGPVIWNQLRARRWNKDAVLMGDSLHLKPTLLSYLAMKHADPGTGSVSVFSTIRIMSILLVKSFYQTPFESASVAVWVMFQLAIHKEHLASLQEEMHDHIDPLTHDLDISDAYNTLKKAMHLDSFIREVLRTKGDTLRVCRCTTEDVPLAGFKIPKGSLVLPFTTLSHENTKYHGPDASIFRPQRWEESEAKSAVMGSSIYFPFGLGRWACPGRYLAVTEIKMIVWSMVCRATPRLEGDAFTVIDPLNVTSVPPEGELILEPLYP
ncbi:cytochrome P450 [Laetiporus sulphureus 93-53]|uniref:Cytochrome P450 n=1 Tax=Laetiporus sulphureus 93-53 TaxID=1314785 RepID=A0A165BQP8_9APHY|nr:cytochrome P450 [Laetiporus sulphureus 93-53]KZT01479.1 cytochrome P450 [Laetiporus sulphureus 93-53]